MIACDGPESDLAPSGGGQGEHVEHDVPRLPADLAEQHPVLSPNAKVESHLMILEERAHPRHPGDGGGRAWLERVVEIEADGERTLFSVDEAPADGRPTVPAGSRQRFDVVFEVGPEGIDEGGVLFFDPEPFWGWSASQVLRPDASGYTTAKPRRADVVLEPGGPTASFRVTGRALESGERIQFVYGAGPSGARVDDYAERGAELMLAVDADGDGLRAWLDEPPRIDVTPREMRALFAFGPAEVAPGAVFEINLAAVDAAGNRTGWPGTPRGPGDSEASGASGADDASDVDIELEFEIEVLAESNTSLTDMPKTQRSRAAAGKPHTLRFEAPDRTGTLRLAIRGSGPLAGFEATLDPILIRQSTRRLYWGDLHGHSRMSDGTGTPEDYFAYARDVARLDIAALTDHDHWGPHPLDESPDHAAEILANVIRFHEPGRFVTLPGYEWTSWLHGHRHVLYFDEHMPIHSAVDAATDRPDELWEALRGQPALTFAHHSAGEPIATNMFYPPDPELEPVTEIVSVHGMSEALDAPLPVRGGIPGNFVRDTLQRGARLGFIGSGDSHDGHPGLAYISSGQAGLAGIFAKGLDREHVLEALRERRTFATNGMRAWLEVQIDETWMGGVLPSPSDALDAVLRIRFEGTAPIEGIDLVRSGAVASLPGQAGMSLDLERRIPRLSPGEFHYVRIRQTNGGVAWSSPIFAGAARADLAALAVEVIGESE